MAVNGSNSACAVLSSISGDGLCENRPFDDARRCIGEATAAIETTKERWREAEVNRMVGEIALNSPGPDVAKAQGYFDRALSVAREQQAKSWELRAAMSMARLWRNQGKRDEARDLLAPVYGWFIEGLETLDLKQVKLCAMRFRRESIGCPTRTYSIPTAKSAGCPEIGGITG